MANDRHPVLITIFDRSGRKKITAYDDAMRGWPNEESVTDYVMAYPAKKYPDHVVEVMAYGKKALGDLPLTAESLKWRFRTGRAAGQTSVRLIRKSRSAALHHATKKKKSSAQLDHEIAEAVATAKAREISDRRIAALIALGEDVRNTPAWRDAMSERRMINIRSGSKSQVSPPASAGRRSHAITSSAGRRRSSRATKKSTSEGTVLKYGKFGLSEDPRGLHVMMTWKGQKLLGTVRNVRRDDITGSTHLIVRHFNGEPWPIEPIASAVRVI